MQGQGKRSLWLLGWLIGALWLLGGCVAPDGSLIRLQQAPDGSIVGWQIDAPSPAVATPVGTAPAKENAMSYPERPLLYLDVWAQNEHVSINAVDQTGGNLSVVGEGQVPVLLGWSRQGDHFAYFAVDDATSAIYLEVVARGEEGKRIVEFEPDELTSYWGMAQVLWAPAAWSPDGKQIALTRGLVWEDQEKSRIELVDVAGGKVAGKFALPKDLTTPFTIEWSPDGQKLIVNGDTSSVLDLKSGKWAQFRGYPTLTEWLPGSDGVLYVSYGPDGSDNSQPAGLWAERWGEKPQQLLTSDQLLALGLDVNERLDFALSPTGRQIALLNSGAWDEEGSTLVVLDFALLQSGPTEGQVAWQPLAQWQLPDAITPVQWSPDETALAFLQASEKGVTLEVLPLSAASAQSVTEVSSGDVSQARDALVNLINMPFQLLSWMP